MGSNNEISEPIKKKANIEDFKTLSLHNKYRVHLTRDFRSLFDIAAGDQLIVVKEGQSECPHCNKSLRLPGYRLFVVKKEDYALVIEKAGAPVRSTQVSLA